MKRKSFALTCFLILVSCFLTSSLFAEPQLMRIKTGEKRSQEFLAREQAKKIKLSDVKDPEVRKILRAVLDQLGLSYRE